MYYKIFLTTPNSLMPPLCLPPYVPCSRVTPNYSPPFYSPSVTKSDVIEEEILPDFKCSVCSSRIITYTELTEHIEHHKEDDFLWHKSVSANVEEEFNCEDIKDLIDEESFLSRKCGGKELVNLSFGKNTKGSKKAPKLACLQENSSSTEENQSSLGMEVEVVSPAEQYFKNSPFAFKKQGCQSMVKYDKLVDSSVEKLSVDQKDSHRIGMNKTDIFSKLVPKNSSLATKDLTMVQSGGSSKSFLESLSIPSQNQSLTKTGAIQKAYESLNAYHRKVPLVVETPVGLEALGEIPNLPPVVGNSVATSHNSLKECNPAYTSLYQCAYCVQAFRGYPDLRRHIAMHRYGNDLRCVSCSTEFSCLSSLRKHFLMLHCETKDRRQCPYCPYRCFQSSDLEKHIARRHTRDFRYKCHFCVKGFTTPKELKRHVRCKHLI